MIRASAYRFTALRATAAIPLMLLLPQLRHLLESRMLLHMTVELPLLLLSGVAASSLANDRFRLGQLYDELDVHGLFGAALVAGMSLFWMLPVSLDVSLLSTPLRLAKYAGWWIAGLALRRTWPRLDDESLVFFAGNMSWMLATAGLLYQASDARLCVNYLLDDQLMAGRALVFAAVLLGIWAIFRLVRAHAGATSGSPRQL